MAASESEETVCPTNWMWKMFIHLLYQPITLRQNYLHYSAKGEHLRQRGTLIFPLCLNLGVNLHELTVGVFHVNWCPWNDTQRWQMQGRNEIWIVHIMPSVCVRRHRKKQPFIWAHMGFTTHCLPLIKESSLQLKVNDSASITGAYVDQMMRLLIGL